MGTPDPNARNLFALPKEQEWGLRQTSCWHRCRQLQGAFLVSPGAPHHPTHLSVSSQLQAELALLTGAQCATSRGDFCCAEACLVPQQLADT